MADKTTLYISMKSSDGHLVIDGPMSLWRELLSGLNDPRAMEQLIERIERLEDELRALKEADHGHPG